MALLVWVASFLLLTGGALSLAFTVHSMLPAKHPRVLVLAFAASLLTIELAGHHLFIQMAVATVLVALGAAKTLPGQIGLALSVVSWIGLAYLVVEGRWARDAMKRALGSFVTDWSGARVPRSLVLLALPLFRSGVRVTRNVVYSKVAGRRLKLDVYEPTARGTLRPAIVQIHGGAWIVGDKREQGVPLCMHLAAAGWVAFNVNYRLSPGATFPEHLVDLKRAIAWIRERADEYGIDPDFIAVTGGSAGGHLAALVALTADDPEYQPGFEQADTRVQAAVPFYGIYDFTNRYGTLPEMFIGRLLQAHVMKARLDEEPEKFAKASPLDRVRADAPPFLVVHGNRDILAPLRDAKEFVEKLRAVSKNEVFFAEISGAQHAFDIFVSPRSAPVIEGVERFLNAVHARYLAEKQKPRENLRAREETAA